MINQGEVILGIGCDIIEIDRFHKAMQKHPLTFLNKLFSSKEQEYCMRYTDQERHFAARFSAKEAVAKALGVGFGKDLAFLDIEILSNDLGKPSIFLREEKQIFFENPLFHLSMSHCQAYATAMVIATKRIDCRNNL